MSELRDPLTIQAAPDLLIPPPAIRSSFLSRIAFRFAFIYLALYCEFGLGVIPVIGKLAGNAHRTHLAIHLPLCSRTRLSSERGRHTVPFNRQW